MQATAATSPLEPLLSIGGSSVIWIVAGVVSVYVLIYSAVLFYHWYTYAIQRRFAKYTLLVYTTGALALLSTMITAAFFVQ
jgi:hypothetical protein